MASVEIVLDSAGIQELLKSQEIANVCEAQAARMTQAAGVKYVAEPGGSVRDDNVIAACDQYGMAMAFTGIRLFHH